MKDALFDNAKTIDIRDANLSYVECGEGEPIVFVHGALSDMRTWKEQFRFFSKSHRAFSISRRYASPNKEIAGGAADPWEEHVSDLAEFLDKTNAAPAHLMGNSQGAFICLLLAIRHPELVRTLVLEEAPVLSLYVSTPPRFAELISLFLSHPRTAVSILKFGISTIARTAKAMESGDDELAIRIFTKGVLKNQGFDDLTDERQEQITDNYKPLRAFVLGVGFPAIELDDVRRIASPALLMTGENSPSFLIRLTDRLEELLPNAKRQEIKGASHLVHEDRPAEVNEFVKEFVLRNSNVVETSNR